MTRRILTKLIFETEYRETKKRQESRVPWPLVGHANIEYLDWIYRIDRILELPGRRGLKPPDGLTPSPPGSQSFQCPSVFIRGSHSPRVPWPLVGHAGY